MAVTLENMSFSNYDSKYAIKITSADTYNFNNMIFDQSGTDLNVAVSSGTVTINISGGTTGLTYDTDGATVNIQTTNTIKLTGLVDNTEVRIYTSDLSTELYGVENTSGGTFSYTYSGTYNNAIITIYNIGYEPIRLVVDLGTSDATIPIQQRSDRWYDNPS